MRIGRVLTASILWVGIGFAPRIAQSQVRKLQPTGKLKITLRNLDDSVITSPNNITVKGIVKGKRIVRTCLSDTDGNCEFELPAGIYRIFVQRCPQRDEGCWYQFERAPFRILPDEPVWINLLLEREAVVYLYPGIKLPPQLRTLPPGTPIIITTSARYDSVPIVSSANPGLNLLIEFKARRRGKQIIEYGSVISPADQAKIDQIRKDCITSNLGNCTPMRPNVIVSYDALTIYADTVKRSERPLRLRAEGHVIFEDGKQREHVRAMELTFRDGRALLSVVR
jgi:hypothetical protein